MIDHNNENLAELGRLQHIETLKLVALTLLTLGLYLAVYIRRQSTIINTVGKNDHVRIPGWSILLPQIMALLSLLFFIFHLSGLHAFDQIDDLAGLLFSVSLMIWGFAAREAMHTMTCAGERSRLWFDGLLTLIISPFYFNYRINEIFQPAEVKA